MGHGSGYRCLAAQLPGEGLSGSRPGRTASASVLALLRPGLANRAGLGARPHGRPVTIFPPSQAREQPGRPGFCTRHFLAAGQPGERQEERIELRIGAGQVPFDSAQGSIPAQVQVHHELRERVAEPSEPVPPLEMGCQTTTTSFDCGPPLSLCQRAAPRRLSRQRYQRWPHARVLGCHAASPIWDEKGPLRNVPGPGAARCGTGEADGPATTRRGELT